jgi:hypothetical protein
MQLSFYNSNGCCCSSYDLELYASALLLRYAYSCVIYGHCFTIYALTAIFTAPYVTNYAQQANIYAFDLFAVSPPFVHVYAQTMMFGCHVLTPLHARYFISNPEHVIVYMPTICFTYAHHCNIYAHHFTIYAHSFNFYAFICH